MSSAGETIRTARAEMEGYEKVYWSRDERRGVASLGSLPKDVAAMVKSSGMSRIARSCYVMVNGQTLCIVWLMGISTQSLDLP